MNKRDLAVIVLQRFLGIPYKWGGDDPMGGFDCSGLAIEVLQSTGIIEENKDYTADQLAALFPETDILQSGALVFWDWNDDGKIDHVEMIAIVDDDGEIFTIGAGGGSSATTTTNDAINHNAYVKVRPLRSGYKLVTDPYAGKPAN